MEHIDLTTNTEPRMERVGATKATAAYNTALTRRYAAVQAANDAAVASPKAAGRSPLDGTIRNNDSHASDSEDVPAPGEPESRRDTATEQNAREPQYGSTVDDLREGGGGFASAQNRTSADSLDGIDASVDHALGRAHRHGSPSEQHAGAQPPERVTP